MTDDRKQIPNDHDKFHMMATEVRIAAEELLAEFYGERCEMYRCDCECCERWKTLDALIANPFKDEDP